MALGDQRISILRGAKTAQYLQLWGKDPTVHTAGDMEGLDAVRIRRSE